MRPSGEAASVRFHSPLRIAALIGAVVLLAVPAVEVGLAGRGTPALVFTATTISVVAASSWRLAPSGLVLSAQGVTVKAFLRTCHVSWPAVAGFAAWQDGKLGVVIGVQLRDGASRASCGLGGIRPDSAGVLATISALNHAAATLGK
jgi:hypothetical protein